MPQYGWHVNINNCIACRACEGGCKQEFLLPVGVRRRQVVVEDGAGQSGKPYRRHISVSCMHCEKPACVAACPVGRYWKDDSTNAALRTAFGMTSNPETGLVLIKPSKAQDPQNGVDCIGCRRCIAACPYGAPHFDDTNGYTDKCTGCYHRLFNTKLPAERRKPACVVTCTSLALHFDDMTKIDKGGNQGDYGAAYKTTWGPNNPPQNAKEIADPTYTNPNVRFAPQTNIT